MERYNNLFLIGSSHISKQSIKEIKDAFDNLAPNIVAVELDKGRAYALMSKQTRRAGLADIRKIGLKGFIFAMFGGWASKKLGKMVGVMPGEEMKTAMKLAKKNNVKIAMIDQPIEITLKRFSKTLSWKERWNFVVDIFRGVVLRQKDPLLNFDLSKVPEKKLIKMMISKVKERYPNVYKVIIYERNYYMARKLKNLMIKYPSDKILGVVGAGHLEDIISILQENDGVSYSFTVEV